MTLVLAIIALLTIAGLISLTLHRKEPPADRPVVPDIPVQTTPREVHPPEPDTGLTDQYFWQLPIVDQESLAQDESLIYRVREYRLHESITPEVEKSLQQYRDFAEGDPTQRYTAARKYYEYRISTCWAQCAHLPGYSDTISWLAIMGLDKTGKENLICHERIGPETIHGVSYNPTAEK